MSRASVAILPFRRVAPLLGTYRGVNPWLPLLDPTQERRVLNIGRTVRLASRYTPWTSTCFAQAVAASLLLRIYRVPYALYFGLAPDKTGGPMQAHAWLASGRVAVTGGNGFGQFTVVGCFVA